MNHLSKDQDAINARYISISEATNILGFNSVTSIARRIESGQLDHIFLFPGTKSQVTMVCRKSLEKLKEDLTQ